MTFQEYIYLKLSIKLGVSKTTIDNLFNKVDKDIPESIYEIIWDDGHPINLRLIRLFNIEKRENGYLITQYEHGCFTSSLMAPHRLIIFSKKDFIKSQKFSSVYEM